MIKWIRYTGAAFALFALILAGCASTSLTSQWKSPSYSGPPLKKLMVVGVSNKPGPRRIFEDEFAAALKAAGVEAVQGYTVIPDDGQADKAVLEKAVRDIGADGVLITRLVKTERQTQVSPGYAGPRPAAGFYGFYSGAWGGYYEPAAVYQYDVVTAETSVYGVAADQLLWSGTTQTFDPQNVAKETPGFAKTIIDALRKQGIV
jgi:hypothetical protein